MPQLLTHPVLHLDDHQCLTHGTPCEIRWVEHFILLHRQTRPAGTNTRVSARSIEPKVRSVLFQ